MDLVKLSREKGFESNRDLTNSPGYYYLWMCELQKWVIDKYSVIASPGAKKKKKAEYHASVISFNKELTYYRYSSGPYSSWEKALEISLFNALKLLPNIKN